MGKPKITLPEDIAKFVEIENCDDFLGREIEVRVFEANMEEDKLILSAKEILKERRELSKKKKLSDIHEGQVFHGVVATIKEYGAFVDLEDGLSGLVHISQISHNRIKHPGVVLKEGQEVDVKVIGVKDGKISLSIKALLDDTEEQDTAEEELVLPETGEIGTSLGDLLKDLKLDL